MSCIDCFLLVYVGKLRLVVLQQKVCLCGQLNKVDYTNHIIRDVLIAGIYDADIRREIMGVEHIIDMPVNGVVSMVEKREMARNANSFTANASALSSYRQKVKKFPDNHRSKPPGFTSPVLPAGTNVPHVLSVESNFHPL